MNKIKLTPEVIGVKRNNEPLIRISKSGFYFNHYARKLLALKPGSYFSLIIENKKLYYQDEAREGFRVRELKSGSFGVRSVSFIKAMIKYGILKEAKTTLFEIGVIKDGKRELIPINNKK